MEKFSAKYSVILTTVLIIFFASANVFAATLSVCQPSGCTYSTIAAALNAAAASGDTIVISSNISEDCAIPNNLNKTVAITSDGTRRTWTNAGGSNVSISNIGTSCNLSFSNLDIVNTTGSTMMNFTNFQPGTTFSFINCTLKNTTQSGRLVDLQNGGFLNFYECELVGNNLTSEGILLESGVGSGKGLYMQNSIIRGISNGKALNDQYASGANATLRNCTFEGNSIAIETQGALTVRNTLFINNTNDLNLTNINAWATAAMNSAYQYCSFHEQTTTISDGGAHAWTGYTGNIFGTPNTIVQDYVNHNLHLDCGDTVYAVDKGANMSAYYTVDKDYMQRPQGTAYDIGAYECPSLQISKSANVSAAYLGDTVTYCITYTNNSTDDKDTDIWDTVPGNMVFSGCDNSCDTQAYGIYNVVHWYIALPPGAYGTVCFYARITDYVRP